MLVTDNGSYIPSENISVTGSLTICTGVRLRNNQLIAGNLNTRVFISRQRACMATITSITINNDNN